MGWFEEPTCGKPSDERGRVHWMSVCPTSQGQGVAKCLLLHVLRVLRKFHGDTSDVFLTTQTTSARAIAMYLEAGFLPEPINPALGSFAEEEQKGWKMLADRFGLELPLMMTPKSSYRKKPLVYLASPLGFSSSLKSSVLPRLVQAVEAVGVEVYEPFERNAQAGLIKKEDTSWAWDVAHADAEAVKNCDAIFAVVNGVPPDEGVCVELGIAWAC